MTTKECKFKIGETYKDRRGGEYLCVSRNDEFEFPLIFRTLTGPQTRGTSCVRRIDGKYSLNSGLNSELDILPNKRKEWVVTFEFHDDLTGKQTEQYRVWGEASEPAARDFVESLKRTPLVFTRVRGPMLWEYEE